METEKPAQNQDAEGRAFGTVVPKPRLGGESRVSTRCKQHCTARASGHPNNRDRIPTMIRGGGHEARGNAAGATTCAGRQDGCHGTHDMAAGSEPDAGSRTSPDRRNGRGPAPQMGPR